MIPMIDLKAQFDDIREEVLKEVNDVMESSRYILGPKVESLEDKMSAFFGIEEAVGVASGTDALDLSLKAVGIGSGDEVITTPFTFFATVESIIYQGARPVFVDIDPETMNIDPGKISEKITDKTKAILPVHMFGMPAEMERISEIASQHGLHIIEDCAQSFGAHINGAMTGSFGDAGCFSFYPSKNLGACGDGGLITVKEARLAKEIRMLRNHGAAGGYIHKRVGLNSRLDELQAAILLVKFSRIEEYNALRREKAAYYCEHLGGYLNCPKSVEGYYHVYHQYTIRTPHRDFLKTYLHEHGISSVIYYPVPLHLQDAVADLGYSKGDFPHAEKASSEVLSLPIYPELGEDKQSDICQAIIEALRSL